MDKQLKCTVHDFVTQSMVLQSIRTKEKLGIIKTADYYGIFNRRNNGTRVSAFVEQRMKKVFCEQSIY